MFGLKRKVIVNPGFVPKDSYDKLRRDYYRNQMLLCAKHKPKGDWVIRSLVRANHWINRVIEAHNDYQMNLAYKKAYEHKAK